MGKKLFDFCIGNPPYQSGDNESNSRQSPVYPFFYDAAERIAEKYILISPARFLFNAGLTSKEWNRKMLQDSHIKVAYFNQNASEIFSNTDIKGGIVIIYRNEQKCLGPIEEFIPNKQLRNLLKKIKMHNVISLMSIMHGGRSDLKFNDIFINDFPNTKQDRLAVIQKKNAKVKELAPNEEYEIKSSVFDVLPYAFEDEKPDDELNYYKILGLSENKRVWRWIKRKYLVPRDKTNNIEKYKVLISKASGIGQFGETLSEPIIAAPGESSTPTFISLGYFENEMEAENAAKYIQTKFVRTFLGILKITQDIVPSKWKYVPLQDFNVSSDIDWSQSIHDIDQQLYKKYDLSPDEIDFIENNVKEMV